ncbi:hypothetical protein [Streptomyces sp. NPDC058272]|uniref:hypothetical protein n=1 Tax=Streptomyces sp. NPDC058272 TaxID=3346415 RepID=UPI0036E9FA1A
MAGARRVAGCSCLAASSVQPARSGGRGRQVLVGDFSPEDCDDYRARRLASDGQPLISEPVRRVITGRSHGLPLYLDLSVMRFLELRRTGRTPQPADFDHDFPVLVSRTLSDLTPDERHVLRPSASWTPSTSRSRPGPRAWPMRHPPCGSSSGPSSAKTRSPCGRSTCTGWSAPRSAPLTTTPTTGGQVLVPRVLPGVEPCFLEGRRNGDGVYALSPGAG